LFFLFLCQRSGTLFFKFLLLLFPENGQNPPARPLPNVYKKPAIKQLFFASPQAMNAAFL
jgi:hypothetical protein